MMKFKCHRNPWHRGFLRQFSAPSCMLQIIRRINLPAASWMPPLPTSTSSWQKASETLPAARESSQGGEAAVHGRQRRGWQQDEAGHIPPGRCLALVSALAPIPKAGSGVPEGSPGASSSRSGGMWGWEEWAGGAEGEGLGKDVCCHLSTPLWALQGAGVDTALCWKATKCSRVSTSFTSEKCLAGHGVPQPVSRFFAGEWLSALLCLTTEVRWAKPWKLGFRATEGGVLCQDCVETETTMPCSPLCLLQSWKGGQGSCVSPTS